MTDIILDACIKELKSTIQKNKLYASMLITDEYLNIKPKEIHENIIKRQLANEFAKAIQDRIEPTENEHYRSGAGYGNIRRFDAKYVMLSRAQYEKTLKDLEKIRAHFNFLGFTDWTPDNEYTKST